MEYAGRELPANWAQGRRHLRIPFQFANAPSFHPFRHKNSNDCFADSAETFDPIFDVFDNEVVRLGLQVHASEIVLEMSMAHWPLEAIGRREPFGFNFDTSPLHRQRVDPAKFLREFRNRIYHVHMKDAALNLAGVSGIFASRLNFCRPDQGRAFRALGHGGLDAKEIIGTLNRIGYQGPFPSSGGIAGWTTKRGRPKPTGSPSTWTSSHLLRRSTPSLRIEACPG